MSTIADLAKNHAKRVMGIDASTHSLAFCIIEDGLAVRWGEILFDGADVYERILDAKRKIKVLKEKGVFDADLMVLEAAVMVRSAATGLKMAYVVGAILGELISEDIEIYEVHPISWQSSINNKNFTKAQKLVVKEQNPGKSESWIKNRIREMRKQVTIDFVKSFGVNTDNNNVSDAAGIAWFAYNQKYVKKSSI